MHRVPLCLLLVFAIGSFVHAAEPLIQRDVPFAKVDGTELKLDFYPSRADEDASPLIVWVHGGAWRAGDKRSVPIQRLTEHGFAIASLDYRLSGTARFPAQTEDIKAGIRFVRAHADRFEIDPDRIVIAGASAGGHLAALVGVSSGVQALENLAMGNAEVSSDVAAIVSLYGASNLQTILSQSTPHGLSVREPALKLLLGDLPTAVPEAARLASPLAHVDSEDPPLLLIHGDQDPQMPINQSHELEGAYRRAGLDATFHVVHGAAHGGKAFYHDEQLKRIADWIHGRLE
ncbi:Carboxylesterase NlhH [Stieleria maiorica]|uniref:Carboxylesterase NlhH n=1 Tax=Stieleria maiorica TaxID=2795974 RepID=A0A5B9MNY9_9BACT|nr:alpha/beta hydrolase [Stieleria maiorica]QEG01346.1 Carboxylesterase NlhH [Stieleria maiorica]